MSVRLRIDGSNFSPDLPLKLLQRLGISREILADSLSRWCVGKVAKRVHFIAPLVKP